MTLLEELTAAARGFVALIIGQRDVPRYFDFSYRGLVGSAIALLAALATNAYLPAVFSGPDTPAPPGWQSFFTILMVLALQLGFVGWLLRQIGRLDGYIPYLVASNWAALFATILSVLVALTGLGAEPALLLVGIVVIVVEVNIARLIVTLTPWQIVALLAVQAIGGFIGLMIIGAILPAPDALTI